MLLVLRRRREERAAGPGGEPEVEGFRDLELIGQGGFSQVYRGYQKHLDRVAALKIIRIGAAGADDRRRFERECSVTGRLSSHPYVVTVFETGFTKRGEPFIAMEHFGRGSLADLLKTGGTFRVADVIDIGVKVAGALDVAHRAGILHRDIKPHNVLMSDYGEPALADFGIAAVTQGHDPTVGPQSLTPGHAPPEVLEGKPSTIRSDIYSLASTLYTLLAGRPPFDGDADEGVLPRLLRILEQPVPAIPRGDVPAELQRVLETALAKDPKDRFESAAAFADALRGGVTTLSALDAAREAARDSTEVAGGVAAGVTADAPLRPAPASGDGSGTRSPAHDIASSTVVGPELRPRRSTPAREDDRASKRRATVLIAIVSITAFAVYLGGRSLQGAPPGPSSAAPPTSAGLPAPDIGLPAVTKLVAEPTYAVLYWENASRGHALVLQRWRPGSPPTTEPERSLQSAGVGTPGTYTFTNLDPASPYCFRVGVALPGQGFRFKEQVGGGLPESPTWRCREAPPVPAGEAP